MSQEFYICLHSFRGSFCESFAENCGDCHFPPVKWPTSIAKYCGDLRRRRNKKHCAEKTYNSWLVKFPRWDRCHSNKKAELHSIGALSRWLGRRGLGGTGGVGWGRRGALAAPPRLFPPHSCDGFSSIFSSSSVVLWIGCSGHAVDGFGLCDVTRVRAHLARGIRQRTPFDPISFEADVTRRNRCPPFVDLPFARA